MEKPTLTEPRNLNRHITIALKHFKKCREVLLAPE